MKHKIFIKNAAILTATSLILRTVGIFFRVWLSSAVGAEGMGLYQLSMSVYVFASTFATCGICTAVTRLVSEGRENPKGVLKRSILLSLLISAVTFIPVFLYAEEIAVNIVCDVRCTLSIKALCFSLPFMGVSSCFRGYFIGRRNTAAPSSAQLVEQAVRIVVIMLLVNEFRSGGLAITTAAILIGDSVAEAAGTLVLYAVYLKDKRHLNSSLVGSSSGFRKMLHIAAPITLGRYIHTFLRTIENILVPLRLSLFLNDKSVSLEQYGMLKGMAMPILFFPASFLTAFSTLMIPEISEALIKNQMLRVKTAVEKSISITVIISTAIGGIFLLLGVPIANILYSSKDTGILIASLSPLVPFMYLESVCDGILKGLDQQTHSFVYSVIDSLTRIVLIYFAVSRFGMVGFILIMVYSNLLTSILNIRRLLKVTKTPFKIGSWILKPLFAVCLALLLGSLAIRNVTGDVLSVVIGGGVLILVYVFSMFFMGELKIIDGIF